LRWGGGFIPRGVGPDAGNADPVGKNMVKDEGERNEAVSNLETGSANVFLAVRGDSLNKKKKQVPDVPKVKGRSEV